jgi:glyoxylase-like metal-dependent hydrolase (beta-lactamase superfamily II)
VKRIILTHRHGDHAGAVGELAKATGATVYAHADEAAAVAQQENGHKDVKPLKEGDVVPVFEGLRAIETPGHTSGHLCFYLPQKKVLFTGDSMLNRGGISGPVAQYTPDMGRAHSSLREKIAPLDVDVLCVSHGDVIQSGAGPQIKTAIGALS